MTAPRCPRLWEAEAVEDGRLDGAGRASFARHAAGCAACAREAAWLAELRKMRSISALEPSPMERRRLRGAILREANAQIVGPGVFRAGSLFAAAAAAALVIGLLVRRGLWEKATATNPPPSASAEQSDPLFEITPSERAEWRIVRKGPSSEVSLAEGTLSVHVQKLREGQRFVMSLPDGELEVRGTRFEVAAHDHATTEVRVSEGAVALRITGFSERLLVAGETWTRPVEQAHAVQPVPIESSGASMAAAPPSAGAPARGRTRRGAESGARASGAAADDRVRARSADSDGAGASSVDRDGAVAQSAEDSRAGAAFREAMAAFNAGAFADADRKLARFEREFPGDARAEDASFLRIVCASRRGDRDGALERARAYLAAHPNGLRRSAVEDLLR